MITFQLSVDSVRNLCIANDWYTRGDVEAYAEILNYVRDYCSEMCDIDVQVKIEHVAADILWHSSVDSLCNLSGCTTKEVFDNIAFVLLNKCTLYIS